MEAILRNIGELETYCDDSNGFVVLYSGENSNELKDSHSKLFGEKYFVHDLEAGELILGTYELERGVTAVGYFKLAERGKPHEAINVFGNQEDLFEEIVIDDLELSNKQQPGE